MAVHFLWSSDAKKKSLTVIILLLILPRFQNSFPFNLYIQSQNKMLLDSKRGKASTHASEILPLYRWRGQGRGSSSFSNSLSPRYTLKDFGITTSTRPTLTVVLYVIFEHLIFKNSTKFRKSL